MDAPEPLAATAIEPETGKTVYPAAFAARVNGRIKRKLGNFFGLNNFGVNLTELAPGAISALKHHHAKQDEFIYIVSGTPTLIYGDEEFVLQPGDCCGFACGTGLAHQLVNRSAQTVSYLEIGDRTPGDHVEYPDDDLCADSDAQGRWRFSHRDGTLY